MCMFRQYAFLCEDEEILCLCTTRKKRERKKKKRRKIILMISIAEDEYMRDREKRDTQKRFLFCHL